MLGGPRGNDTEAAAGAGADPVAPSPFDNRWIDLIFAAIAVDGGARGAGDDRPAAALKGSPDQSIDERVLERGQRGLARGCEPDQPVRIVAAGVRHRQQYRQFPTRLVDRW